MKRRLLSAFLALALCLSLLPAAASAADSTSGTCGGNTRWMLQDGVLTISGTGAMADYDSPGSVPWYNQRTSITSVIIGADVTRIGDRAFSGCSSLTSVTIPNGVAGIGTQAFYQCSSLMGAAIPDSVYSIGDSAFAYCSNLMGMTIPANLYNIGSGVFQNCTHLVAIQAAPENYLYASVDGVLFGKDLDGKMVTLKACPGGKQGSYTIPDSVTTIEFGAFSGCEGLTGITIPKSVTTIEAAAFAQCKALTSITIPNSVTSIGTSAFAGCTGLTAIQLESGNQNYTTVDGVLLTKDRTVLAACPAGKQGAYTIPGSVTYIWPYAFSLCTGLTGVTIPNSVTGMGTSAFVSCESLTSVTIPGSMYSIAPSAFSGCTSLRSVTLPNSLGWIGDSAFWGCENLTGITIPNSVAGIGDYAFKRCTSLTSITLPDSVTSIGVEAFWGCTRLGSVVIPAGVTRIEPYTFSTCTGLTSVTLPSGITSIGTSAFYGCSSLTGIALPDSVTSIGESAFYECTGLTSLTFPRGVTSIANWTAYGCSNLRSVTIPSSVTSIGYAAFWNNTSLKDVYYTGTQYQWNSVKVGDYNTPLTSAAVHCNSTGPSNPTPSQQLSDWARADVDRAITMNILPAELRGAYTQAATRREFCLLADALYTAVKGSAAPQTATFSDTSDPAVLRMASVGVVNGVGDGTFNPAGQLTREQAATMLARLANALGRPLTASEPTFADNGGISDWARAAVGQMQRSGVMGGVGDNRFSPAGSYTREQSVVTIMRLYDLMK